MPNSARKTKSAARRAQGKQLISHPPQFTSTKKVSGRARYVAASAVSNVSIIRGFLLNHLVMNSNNTTSNYRLLSAFRLKSVEVWGTTSTLGKTTTVSVEWVSTTGPSTIHSDTSIGTAEPAHIRTTPPRQSLASFWCISGSAETESLFILNCPDGAVVDITYDMVLQNGESPVLNTSTGNGVTGTVYMTYLAGLTTTTLVPQSYASIT